MSAPNILIVGGGRRSMRTAPRLERLLRLCEVTVVADPWSYMTYQPLLAEAAAGNLEPRHVVVPLCGVLRRTKVIKGAVSSVDHAHRVADNIVAVLHGGGPRAYRHTATGSVAKLGLYRGVAGMYGIRMRSFPTWLAHRTYHLLKLPTMNRCMRVVSDWTPALLFRRETVSLDALEHPRENFQTALRAIFTGASHARPS